MAAKPIWSQRTGSWSWRPWPTAISVIGLEKGIDRGISNAKQSTLVKRTSVYYVLVPVCGGGIAKWPNASDCKSDDLRLRRFESFSHHHFQAHNNKALSVLSTNSRIRYTVIILRPFSARFRLLTGTLWAQSPSSATSPAGALVPAIRGHRPRRTKRAAAWIRTLAVAPLFAGP